MKKLLSANAVKLILLDIMAKIWTEEEQRELDRIWGPANYTTEVLGYGKPKQPEEPVSIPRIHKLFNQMRGVVYLEDYRKQKP